MLTPTPECSFEEPRYIACVVAYDGTDWCGFQRQKNGQSVQGEIERALAQVLKEPTPIVAAGRTDAGVHATGQVCRFATHNRIPAERVALALNGNLDPSVRVSESWEVTREFHPRFSATSRMYRYWIENAAIANPLVRRYAGLVREPLNTEAMQEAAYSFIGQHDFAAWQSAGSPLGGTVREITNLKVRRQTAILGSDLIEVEIEANAFLYQMVRNIVGALIEVGRGNLAADRVGSLTEGRDRTKCPPPAPPQGLCLVKVKY